MAKQVIVTESNCKVGTKVVQGRDWDHGSQDRGSVYGVISDGKPYGGESWISVDWVNSKGEITHKNSYRIGYRGKYDLYLYNEAPIKKTVGGYKKIADYPGAPSENELVHFDGTTWWTKPFGQAGRSVSNPENYPQFWEPIYRELEPKTETVFITYKVEGFDLPRVNGLKAVVTEGQDTIILSGSTTGSYNIEIGVLRKLVRSFDDLEKECFSIGGYFPNVYSVSFGCHQNILVSDIIKIIDAWNKLNG